MRIIRMKITLQHWQDLFMSYVRCSGYSTQHWPAFKSLDISVKCYLYGNWQQVKRITTLARYILRKQGLTHIAYQRWQKLFWKMYAYFNLFLRLHFSLISIIFYYIHNTLFDQFYFFQSHFVSLLITVERVYYSGAC